MKQINMLNFQREGIWPHLKDMITSSNVSQRGLGIYANILRLKCLMLYGRNGNQYACDN